MPFMQRITWSGIALHESKSVPSYPASHGCIRLQNPDEFAEYLLSLEDDVRLIDRFKRKLNKGMQYTFSLNQPFDIHIRYLTCVADENGNLFFYDDIYEKDSEFSEYIESKI